MPEKWIASVLLWAGVASLACAQPSPEMQQVLQRMDRLEAQNRELMTEIRGLREQIAAASPAPAQSPPAQSPPEVAAATPAAPIEERVAVAETRISQEDQEKISTDHRLPLTLTGMLLFNAFWSGHGAGGADNPTLAAVNPGPVDSGATFRQSVVGVKFDGPSIAWGGKVTGSAYIDFFGGSSAALSQLLRLRVASVNAMWKNTTLTVALDKPILAPREPDSLAQVGVSPLTSAGNLWLWEPQVRVEQRFALGDQAGLRAQVGIYQTAEGGTGVASAYAGSLGKARPGYEGRFEFWAARGEYGRLEIAPGFHASSSRVLDESVPSRIFSVDWLFRPSSRVDFTGQFFAGENTGVIGGLRQGVTVFNYERIAAVRARGGWAQIKFHLTPRATLNFYGGQEDDRNRDLLPGGIAKNQAYAGSLMYRFGSNVLGSFETSQVRTSYLSSGTRLFTHYDLAIAYLF
jgi:hypothetical protein